LTPLYDVGGVPAYNALIDKARRMPPGLPATHCGQRLDATISEDNAPWVVFMNRQWPKFVSSHLPPSASSRRKGSVQAGEMWPASSFGHGVRGRSGLLDAESACQSLRFARARLVMRVSRGGARVCVSHECLHVALAELADRERSERVAKVVERSGRSFAVFCAPR
jgi:hypothetical protein